MKKKKYYLLLPLIIFCVLIFKSLNVFAAGQVNITSNVKEVIKGEEFEISVSLQNISAAAFQLELYFNSNKLEFINNLEQCNQIDNTVFFTWVDETGGENETKNGESITFRFKAKEVGEASFGVTGLFFDKNGNEIVTSSSGITISITEAITTTNMAIQSVNASDNNSYLQIMRIGIEGISPDFDKNITEYILVVGTDIINLDIIAVPENMGSTVNISGNTNLKNGLNKVTIEIISKDKSSMKIYTINVTKTAEPNKANSNLETLAIEYYSLAPEFSADYTQYKVNVSSDTQKINILAIPESTKATASISNKDVLDYGDNIITVSVTAENGITVKNYIINAHRRTIEEEELQKQEQQANAQRLSDILAEKNLELVSNEYERDVNNAGNKIIRVAPTLVLLGILLLLIIYLIATKRIKIIRRKR